MSDFESEGFRRPNLLESKFESSTIPFGTPNRLTLMYGRIKCFPAKNVGVKKANYLDIIMLVV